MKRIYLVICLVLSGSIAFAQQTDDATIVPKPALLEKV